MAGYANISATSFMLRITKQKDLKATVYSIHDKSKKIFISMFLNRYRTIGLVDNGSDLTLMQYSLFKKLNKNAEQLFNSEYNAVNSYTDHEVRILGEIDWLFKLNLNHSGINFTVYVVTDNKNSPPLLIGNDLLMQGMGCIAYTGCVESPTPEVSFNYPEPVNCEVYHVSPYEQFVCHVECTLEPQVMTTVEFYLSPACPVIRTDFVLITSQENTIVNIIPSRSDLMYNRDKDCYMATGCVINMGRKREKFFVTGKIELINQYKAVPIDQDREKLRSTLISFPLGREILVNTGGKNSIPTFSVNQLSFKEGTEVKVSDMEFADTVHLKEPTYSGEADISPEIIETEGIDLPTVIYENAEQAIDLDSYSEEIRPFIKKIFLEKYPQVVSLHALDAGNLSLTLGYTQLRLREGEVLPRSKRIFHISPSDQRHLDDICDLMIRFGYITRSPISPTGHHLFGMSAYLVPRAKPGCLGRLIVDFSPVNQLIESPASVIPEISASLQFLQNKALYSSLDLRYAYLSLRIDEKSRPLTTFLTPSGSFQWLALPTGAANSPAYFTNACNRILHYEPERDKDGNVIYESKNVVKLRRDVLKEVVNFFDDIIITSLLKPTYHATLQVHFDNLEKTISRLAFHGAKISVPKCEFAKTKIVFLGWYVSKDFVMADPRRIEKVKEYVFPDSKKAVRAFLGLVNSLRRVIKMDVISQVAILTPLTSAKVAFNPEEKHRKAFEQIKKMLTQEPLFNNLIDEKAPKYLWVDAATSSGVLGAVLAQRKVGVPGEKIVPDRLDLDDEIHRVLYDRELPYEPVQLYTKLPIKMPKTSVQKTVPPSIEKKDALLGFTEENVVDSLCWSVISILALYNCSLPNSTFELRELAVKKLKAGILGTKLRDFDFNLNYKNYQQFLEDFKLGKVGPDREFYLIDALAIGLYRPIIIISALKRHSHKPIIHFNNNSDRPPLIFGLYQRGKYEIFKPFFLNKHMVFKLDDLKGKIQVVAYVAKTIPEAFKSRPILDLEVFAILTALYSLQRFISGVPVTLLTDSRVLFYLFSAKVGNSSVKIKRWCLKLLSDYPQVKLHFVRTTENLADFLTREGLPTGDLDKFNIKDVNIRDFHAELPKETFTLQEWIAFVEANPQYLTINNPEKLPNKAIVLSLSKGLDNVKDIVTPLEILQGKLSRAEIIKNQKKEYATIYGACLAGKDFEYSTEHAKVEEHYKLISDLLMKKDNFYKILVPPSMIGILLAHTHLLGHKGIKRMLADLESYTFVNKYSITKRFVSSCYACFLSYKGSRKQKIGIYPTPNRAFEEITMDLAENLNNVNGYSHILVIQCVFSDFVILQPLKSKTSHEISRVMLYGVLQNFNVQRLHSDNGPAFRGQGWLELMSALGIKVIASAALHPAGRGQVERLVGTVKIMMRKMLATQPTLNWEFLPFLVAKILNTTVSPKTGYKPCDMVFGPENAGNSFLDTDKLGQPHYFVKSNLAYIETLSKDIREATGVAKDKLTQLRLENNEKVNKNRTDKNFKVNDYVFVIDRTQVPGSSRILRTKLNPSPYIVLRPLWTTSLVKRLADGFTTLYSNTDLKRYDGKSPLFNTLPPEISKVLLHTFDELINTDMSIITANDTLEIPNGITLFQNEASTEPEGTLGEDWLNYPQAGLPSKNVQKDIEQEQGGTTENNLGFKSKQDTEQEEKGSLQNDFDENEHGYPDRLDIEQDIDELEKDTDFDKTAQEPGEGSDSEEEKEELEASGYKAGKHGMTLRDRSKRVHFEN